MSDLDALWSRLEAQLAALAALDPGWWLVVSEAELADAERAIGRPLPDDYRWFLRRRDGQSEDFGVSILSAGGRLAPLAEVVKRREEMLCWKDEAHLDTFDDGGRVRRTVFHPDHLEIGGTLCFDGANTVLDFVPGPAGREGQLLARVSDGSHAVVGDSFGDYLRRVVEGLEQGTLGFASVEGVVEVLDVANKRAPWLRCEPVIRKIPPALP